MTKEETAKFLTLINSHFQSFIVTAEIVGSWHLILKDLSPKSVWAVYRAYLAQGKEFAPNVSQILALARKAKDGDSGAFYWGLLSNGRCRKSQLSSVAIQAFDLWGGRDRMNGLPDPSNPWIDNQRQAVTEVSFARKEFIELFDSLYSRESLAEVREVTAIEAREFLDKLNLEMANKH